MSDLPNNWQEVAFTDVFDVNGGTQPPKSQFISEPKEGYIRLLQIRDFGAKPVPTYVPDTGKLRTCKKDDVLIARYGASIGRIVTGMEGAYNVALAKVNVPDNIDKKFAEWVLKSHIFQNMISSFQRTAQNGFNKTDLAGIRIPLPPLTEQNRMVAKLDVLFGELESLKSRLANIPELLKNFRQAVLTQAVTGKLTAEWRESKDLVGVEINEVLNENYALADLPTNWKHSVISELGLVKGGKRLPKGEELVIEDTGFPYIRARDLKQGTVLTDNMMFLNQSTQEKISRYIVSAGDLYITIVGAKIGDAGIIPLSMNGANLTENAAKITELNGAVFNEYLSLWLRSKICQQNIQRTIMSAAQGKLALTRIKELPVYMPPKKEQEEIVRRVEGLFAQASAIEEKYKALKERITELPQAILAKAFRGELVEQLPTDGDAKELLEEIKLLKEKLELEKKNARKKARVK